MDKTFSLLLEDHYYVKLLFMAYLRLLYIYLDEDEVVSLSRNQHIYYVPFI